MKNFIETYDNALSQEECEYIIDYMNTDNKLEPGMVASGVKPHLKDSWDITLNFDNKDITVESPETVVIDFTDTTIKVNEIILESLCNCLDLYVNKHPQLNVIPKWRYHPFYNLQKYNPNQAYHSLHCENTGGYFVETKRMMAWMFYLNTVTDGGGTYFDNYDLTMDAVQGRCVIWPAYWTHMHKGIVSQTETKYIATGWVSFTR